MGSFMSRDKLISVDLGDELIFEILSWLPPETLISCLTVCKSWFSTITTPKFIAKHRSHFGNPHRNTNLGRLVIPSILPPPPIPPGVKVTRVYSDTISGNHAAEVPWYKHNTVEDPQFWKISGSCNGIIFLANCSADAPKSSFVCNPCISRRIVVPPSPASFSVAGAYRYNYGIGFDAVKNDYLVVEFTALQMQASVFSLNLKSWKKVEPPILERWYYINGKVSGASAFVNGFIHWLLVQKSTMNFEDHKSILVFDVHNEVFGEMQLPELHSCCSSDHSLTSISALNGCLCIVNADKRMQRGCDVWTMKEYGVHRSWVVLFKVDELVPRSFISLHLTVGGKLIVGGDCGWRATREGDIVHQKDANLRELKRDRDRILIVYDPATRKYINVCRPLILSDDYFGSVEATLELLCYR